MSLRRRAPDLGEAVSFESILTVFTVLLVLRMVFLVPMVNLDKAKTEAARHDWIWDRSIQRVGRSGTAAGAGPYAVAMGLGTARTLVASESGDSVVWIEAVLADSSVVVVRHDRAAGAYVRLHAQARSEHPSCQYGRLEWSAPESQWFTVADSVDYGDKGVGEGALREYRRWLEGTPP
jgi:hypothetical protein